MLGMVQCPGKRKPPHCKNAYRQKTHWYTEFRLIDTLVAACEKSSCKVADGAGGDAEDATDESTGEEEAVLRDAEVVRGWSEDLGERVGYTYEEGLRVCVSNIL
jgi:hypothetical protein